MTHFTQTQVQEQKERFEAFMNVADLKKIGKTILKMIGEESGLYNHFNYVARVLRLANVSPSMYHPDSMKFYSDILKIKALDAYLIK